MCSVCVISIIQYLGDIIGVYIHIESISSVTIFNLYNLSSLKTLRTHKRDINKFV